LHWRKAEAMLAQLDPQMKFWEGLDFVGRLYDGAPVALNLMDVSLAYSNGEDYEHRYFYHFRESLWNEIFMRYMGHKNLEQQILNQLDNDMVAPEKLTVPKVSAKESNAIKQRQSDIMVRQKLIDADEGHLISVTAEFRKAFAVLEKYDKTVSIFGSARLTVENPAYHSAYELASTFAGRGYAVVTGGGNGIMEAANKGAYESGGGSIGFNINLPTEQKLNTFTTDNYQFEHFFSRKVALTLETSAYIYCPGGFGTLDELFEVVTLQQTGKIPRVPIILFDSHFWQPLMQYVKTTLKERYHTISPEDLDLFTLCDDIDQVVRAVEHAKLSVKAVPHGSRPNARKH
jgi:uncharacterized protein (TIGR00730 family)